MQSLFLRYIFIRKKKGKNDCDVALLSCEKIIAAVLVHFGGNGTDWGVFRGSAMTRGTKLYRNDPKSQTTLGIDTALRV